MDLLTANDRPGAYPASWYAATAHPAPERPPLAGAVNADVVIVGGGYTGLSAALHLAEAGADVVLLEANRVGWGASGRNGGQVGPGQRVDPVTLRARFGEDRGRALWQLGEAARALVFELIARHAIACDARHGLLYVSHRAGFRAEAEEAAALAARWGDAPEILDRAGVAERLGTEAYQGGVLDRRAGHLHPLNYALGLARAAEAAGARLHEGSRVVSAEGGRVATAEGEVRAEHVILAANGYLGALSAPVAARVMPINNFIVATEPLGARAREINRDDLAVADSRFIVNYWRNSADGRLLFGGGETWGYRFPADIARFVRPALRSVYPALGDVRIDHAWGGTLAITRSRLPHLARLGPGLWSASGYSGHGVSIATLSGKLIAEAIRGESAGFDLMVGLPTAPFPGGPRLRAPLLALAMAWYALRDRL